MTIPAEILADIQSERDFQDHKWGSQRNLPPAMWATILGEEFGEVCEEVLDLDNDHTIKLYKELIQVAAVAVCWLEALNAGN